MLLRNCGVCRSIDRYHNQKNLIFDMLPIYNNGMKKSGLVRDIQGTVVEAEACWPPRAFGLLISEVEL